MAQEDIRMRWQTLGEKLAEMRGYL